jgi:molybdopterin-containing oxidoreductase family membrane subunit
LKKELAMPLERYIMGLFKDEDQVVAAINELKQSSYKFIRVNIPFPSHKIMDALKLKKSMVGWFTLGGGIFGFLGGFALAIYTATQWDLIVSGKPIVAIVPFVVVGFEATILCAVFGNILGLLTQGRLPTFKGLKYYDPRCSGEHFGILASCAAEHQDGLKNFFRQQGGEVKVFE